jgi:hypothetical protein
MVTSMKRGRLSYMVGNVHNPGNPFGRSELSIEPDGQTRLVHFPRGGGPASMWTARTAPAVLEAMWTGLDQAGFPAVPKHAIPGGATMRALAMEETSGALQSVMVEWNAGTKLPGYTETFKLLDQVIRQITADAVKRVPAVTEVLVTEIAKA